MFGFERASNRLVTGRQKHQDSRAHQRANALLNVILTGGHVHDSKPALALIEDIKLKGKKILADKAYSCEQIRFFLAEQGAIACIPDKVNFKIKHDFDSDLYKQRNIVERFFQRIKNYRHIATRCDKLPECFLNFVLLAASVIHF